MVKWIHAKTFDNGVQAWAKEDIIDNDMCFIVQYKDSNGRDIGEPKNYPIDEIDITNELRNIYHTEIVL